MLKNTNPALNGGKDAADYEKIDVENENIIAFKRSKGASEVIYVGNFTNENQKVNLSQSGNYKDYMGNLEVSTDTELELAPWGYKILEK